MKSKKQTSELGKGIIIGLIYGFGMFIMAFYKSGWALGIGLLLFLTTFVLHLHWLKQDKIKDNTQ
jgi:uncharacterized membrane protein YgaE (UPF0421/DUF939 family)